MTRCPPIPAHLLRGVLLPLGPHQLLLVNHELLVLALELGQEVLLLQDQLVRVLDTSRGSIIITSTLSIII